jgi:NTP pyrophosphatase (non-canonical NTP hydrolase)
MELNEYQRGAHKTAKYPKDQALTYASLGLVGESGEIANKVKKVIRDDYNILTDERKSELQAELGDVLWYLAELSTILGVSLNKIAKDNLEKLESRARRGKIQGAGDSR